MKRNDTNATRAWAGALLALLLLVTGEAAKVKAGTGRKQGETIAQEL